MLPPEGEGVGAGVGVGRGVGEGVGGGVGGGGTQLPLSEHVYVNGQHAEEQRTGRLVLQTHDNRSAEQT